MANLKDTLIKIQKEMKAPKNQYNSFGGYNYRSCEDVLNAIKPYLDGVYLNLQDEIICVGERYYIKATATLSDDDHSISSVAYAREPLSKKGMDEAQVTGATSSYARKYALNGLLCIDDVRDNDQSGPHEQLNNHANSSKKLMATSDQIKKINELIEQKNIAKEQIQKALAQAGVESINDLNVDQAALWVQRLMQR